MPSSKKYYVTTAVIYLFLSAFVLNALREKKKEYTAFQTTGLHSGVEARKPVNKGFITKKQILHGAAVDTEPAKQPTVVKNTPQQAAVVSPTVVSEPAPTPIPASSVLEPVPAVAPLIVSPILVTTPPIVAVVTPVVPVTVTHPPTISAVPAVCRVCGMLMKQIGDAKVCIDVEHGSSIACKI